MFAVWRFKKDELGSLCSDIDLIGVENRQRNL